MLASNSPRRKEIVGLMGLDFEVRTSSAPEDHDPFLPPEEIVMLLAGRKAEKVAEEYRNELVLGADTIVVLDGKILGKPRDREEAVSMLKSLSGRTHLVYTGVCLVKGNVRRSFFERSSVTFYPLSDDEINAYVATGEPMDKAGAYGIQGRGCLLVKEISGDFYNVMGLPAARTYREIKNMSNEN